MKVRVILLSMGLCLVTFLTVEVYGQQQPRAATEMETSRVESLERTSKDLERNLDDARRESKKAQEIAKTAKQAEQEAAEAAKEAKKALMTEKKALKARLKADNQATKAKEIAGVKGGHDLNIKVAFCRVRASRPGFRIQQNRSSDRPDSHTPQSKW